MPTVQDGLAAADNCGVAGSAPGRWPCAPSQPSACHGPCWGRVRAKLSGSATHDTVIRNSKPEASERSARSGLWIQEPMRRTRNLSGGPGRLGVLKTRLRKPSSRI